MGSKLNDNISENKNLVEDKNKLQKRIVEIEMNGPERAMFDHSVQAVRELNEAASKLGG